MHREAMNEMVRILEPMELRDQFVLDVGSLSVNGSYRGYTEARGGHYTGLDIREGDNVDVVSENPYKFPFYDSSFGITISGSTMEHVEAIWLWFPELFRVTRPGGYVVVLTHTSWEYHPHPVDCWRVMPDGMRYLAHLVDPQMKYEVSMYNQTDISFWAQRRYNVYHQIDHNTGGVLGS